MKIIQSYDSFLPKMGGVETYISNIIANLKGTSFEIVTPQYESMAQSDPLLSNGEIIRFSPIKNYPENKFETFVSIVKDIIRIRRMKKYLNNADYDVFHNHAPCHSYKLFRYDKKIFKNFFLSKLLTLKSNKPTLLTIHHLYYGNYNYRFENDKFRNGYFKSLIESADEIIAVENYSYDYLKYYLKKYGYKQKLHKIYNCVDIKQFQYKKNKLGKKIKLLYVGRLTSEKGVDLLYRLIERLPSFIELNIVASGNESDFKNLNKLVKGNSSIKLYKNISLKKLISMYQNANIVFNPVLFEAITRVTLEAMSCGKPVIMIKKGNRYPVKNNVNGFLIKKDFNELINLLKMLNKNRNKLIEMGKEARKIIEKEFSNEAIMPKIINIYKNIKKIRK